MSFPLYSGRPIGDRPFRLAIAHRQRQGPDPGLARANAIGVVPVRFGRALFDAAPEPKEGWFRAPSRPRRSRTLRAGSISS